MPKHQSRRKFVSQLSVLATGAILAACGDPTNTPYPIQRATTAAVADKPGTEKAPHWTYEGKEGPEFWGDLDPSYSLCKVGKSQTPIDFSAATKESGLKKVESTFGNTNLNIQNNGHTIQVDYDKGSTLVIDDKQYDLAQFHFHAPSEHKFNGQAFPMELHLVHKASDGNLAVIGIMMQEGAENPFLAKFWDKMPSKVEKDSYNITINVKDTYPSNAAYYTYQGSLTTPPCSEGVRWVVLKNPVTVSKAQVDKFISIIGDNARPVQSLNGRDVGEKK